jgi:hypothetical protein
VFIFFFGSAKNQVTFEPIKATQGLDQLERTGNWGVIRGGYSKYVYKVSGKGLIKTLWTQNARKLEVADLQRSMVL